MAERARLLPVLTSLALFPLALFPLALSLALIPPAANATWLSAQQSIMGTAVNITLWADDPSQGEAAMAAAFIEIRRLDHSLSPYIETSELSRLNRNAAQRAEPVSEEMAYLLERSTHYSSLTEGAFDITFASVGFYYDYRKRQQPSAAQTERLLPAINYRWVTLDDQTRTVKFDHANVRIDLGGIAKGYAVDRAAEVLAEHGISHATVSAGGDSKILGDKRGKPWLIGIKHPRLEASADAREPVITLPLADTAVSTSGDYERYFIDERGERVHHIINPRTGRPTQGIMSVTVIGERGVDTDALSTSVFVLGISKGLALIESLSGFDCIIIAADGQVHYSAGLIDPAAS